MPTTGPQGTSIRPATAGDYEAVARLHHHLDAMHADALPRLFRLPPEGAYTPDRYRGELADPDVGFFVAERGGQVVGMAHVSLGDTKPYPVIVPRRVATVNDLVVDERQRRSGIGRALVEQAASWATARGADELELSVYVFNAGAMAFYSAMGFTVLSSRMIRSGVGKE